VPDSDRLRDPPARLAVFASGAGSNLAALLAAFPASDPAVRVALVISDRAEAPALARAVAAGVPAHHLPFGRDRGAFERAAAQLLRAEQIGWVVLAGFMRVLSAEFVATWYGRLVNIHPSLLPAFPGLHAVRQALAAGVRESGCTVHFVDAGVDTGPIIAQRAVPILAGDDEVSLQARIRAVEHQLYPAAIRQLVAGNVRVPERFL
jgi:phosphoribosylglycinamide formyltransferase-1